MNLSDPNKIADIIRDVSAEIIEPRFQNLSAKDIHTKSSPTDLVTIADIEAEENLTKILLDILPGSIVLGEEAVSRNEISLDILPDQALGKINEPIWIIDPVDGTGNFARGDQKFGLILSLVYKGKTVQGWIYDIPERRMAVCEQGSGVEVNGMRKTYATPISPLKETRGFVSHRYFPDAMRDRAKEILNEHFGKTNPYMCCAHEYLTILEGGAFFSLYTRIKPWDHAAGVLMLTEAGGYVRKWDGSEYHAQDHSGVLLCASSPEAWNEIYEIILKPFL